MIRRIDIGREIPGIIPIPPEHWQLLYWSVGLFLGCLYGGVSHLVKGMNKVTTRSIRTESYTVVGAAKVCLVFWVTVNTANFLGTMGKLTLLTILASTVFLEGAAHLSFVARSLLCRGGNWGAGRCLALASVQQGTS